MSKSLKVLNIRCVRDSAWKRWNYPAKLNFNRKLQFYDEDEEIPVRLWNTAFFAACEESGLEVDFLCEAPEDCEAR